ncbi:hypothetical protein [Caballeronia sp. LZ001]|uniref:hypothetical protein n=1 Tax=Caballeronia sp. LZ001 TaxID=3038553 RepID=UPI00285FC610|nr:hypothetical protein [Caballeronia sp. LZ001]MDR5804946.1 hypothetical protein [Caballeronia sp. LZ001]
MLPSLEDRTGTSRKPRILVLEVRAREKPDGPVIVRLLVERLEQYERYPDGTLRQADLEIAYRALDRQVHTANGRGEFRASFSTFDARASVTRHGVWEHGFVTLDLPGLEGNRIGSYLMDEIVAWLGQWPDADVNDIELLKAQGSGTNRARRNRFYERYGFVFDYDDPEQRSGRSQPLKVRDLHAVESWKKNIRERQLPEYISELMQSENQARAEIRRLSRALREELDLRRNAETHPILRVTKLICLRLFHGGLGWVLGALIAFIALAAYRFRA